MAEIENHLSNQNSSGITLPHSLSHLHSIPPPLRSPIQLNISNREHPIHPTVPRPPTYCSQTVPNADNGSGVKSHATPQTGGQTGRRDETGVQT